jgi:phosphoribosylamine-glycine ligase
MASAGYPESATKGSEIVLPPQHGHNDPEEANRAKTTKSKIYHAGSKLLSVTDESKSPSRSLPLVTSGGRVLSITGVGPTIRSALTTAYNTVKQITFPGMQYRKDIAYRCTPSPTFYHEIYIIFSFSPLSL